MTKRRTDRLMDRSHSARPKGETCLVGIVAQGPEDRGQVGRMQIRDPVTPQNLYPSVRNAWLLRCPWCRELIEIAPERVFVVAGEVEIHEGPVDCPNCSQGTRIESGIGYHSNGVG